MNSPQSAAPDAVPFPDEAAHLSAVRRLIGEALAKADNMVARIDREYMDAKRYMAQYRGEIDPHEMFQNELSLKEIDGTGAFAVTVRDKIAKLLDSPYFARVDFRPAGAPSAGNYYIGRFAFDEDGEQIVFDWRAPIANLFYDCELGPAGYDAPAGRVDGEITRKRQFKICGGALEYALESAVSIRDDVLQRELSQTSDERMKSIIATIQREQNAIIRDETAETLIIQGVAGSGKTSIALHRVAYLLYRFRDRLFAGNVAILSPNKVFGDYISNVLPELGEEPIRELRFADLAQVLLENVLAFAPDPDPLEEPDEGWAARERFKSTLGFVEQLSAFLERMPDEIFEPADYACGGVTVAAKWIRERFTRYARSPVKQRLQMLAEDIRGRFASAPFLDAEIPKARTIQKHLCAMLRLKSALALYREFYRQMGRPELFVMPDKKTLEWADVSPFLLVKAAFEGLQEGTRIRHLLVDEMQDYTPVQLALLNRLFHCPKTILGDFGQMVHPAHRHTLADLRQLYQGAAFVELKKSYRSTYEIMAFAGQIQAVADLEPVARHGQAPAVLRCESPQDEAARIAALLDRFAESGRASLGVIAKTDRAAAALHALLSQARPVYLLSPQSRAFVNGVSITSIQMSKGLEFDEVIVADANAAAYCTAADRSLLYIACTRAMHRLTLLYTGEPSPFLSFAAT